MGEQYYFICLIKNFHLFLKKGIYEGKTFIRNKTKKRKNNTKITCFNRTCVASHYRGTFYQKDRISEIFAIMQVLKAKNKEEEENKRNLWVT
jgi:hypothetical protein